MGRIFDWSGPQLAAGRGLVVFRSSRLATLAGALRTLLTITTPASVLQPQTVIAAHPGMKPWLTGELAQQAGLGGVVANLDVLLASTWLDRLTQARLHQQAVSLPRYRRAQLRWTLHELLAAERIADIPGMTDARLRAYLQRPDGGQGHAVDLARRRFQLADRLAAIYSQYLVYRPEWLQAWEAGQFRFASNHQAPALQALEGELLAPLWRCVQSRLGPHRATAVRDLLDSLRANPGALEAVHVFGVSHLPPAELRVLQEYAQHALVFMYVPDPCQRYWGGISESWADFYLGEQTLLASAGDGDYWHEQGHPLLARWGRLGQQFFATLGDGAVAELVDEPESPALDNRLARVQESIRQLDVGLLKEDPFAATARADGSLTIHACHTRLRELEVLRDVLLDAIEHRSIAPGQIVVMAPNIAHYAPLIPSLFGEPGSARERLTPYHMADIAMARSHRLFQLLARLLRLPSSRLSTPELVDLLALPELQRRLNLTPALTEQLTQWLRLSQVAWGLDGKHRASFGVPGIEVNTFAWAVDRLLAGYVMAAPGALEQQPTLHFADGTQCLPLPGAEGPSADLLGALDRLLGELNSWLCLARQPRRASAWSELLQERMDALVRIDSQDESACSAMDAIRRTLAELARETALADEDPVLEFPIVADLITQALERIPERQRFLMGGITFCGMVPQRAIPFDLVCVLGLNDGEFPRSQSDGGLDLMARIRKVGDRDVRTDDRYLFLETVMAAGKQLHLSYIGQRVTDNTPANPAAPLAELLAELERGAGLLASDSTPRPWCVQHPLQPFSARYFTGDDARLFSYSDDYAAMVGSGSGATQPFRRCVEGVAITPSAIVELAALRKYYQTPSEYALKQRMGLSLAAQSREQLRDEEPLSNTLERRLTVARTLFFSERLPMLAAADTFSREPPAWLALGGYLADGRLGHAAWQQELAKLDALTSAACDSGYYQQAEQRVLQSVALDVSLSDRRLLGSVSNVSRCHEQGQAGWRLLRAYPGSNAEKPLKPESELDFKDRIPLFLDWAALRLHMQQGPVRLHVLVQVNDKKPDNWIPAIHAWDDRYLDADNEMRAQLRSDLGQRIKQLAAWCDAATQCPPWYFPATSWALASEWAIGCTAQSIMDDAELREQARQKARATWLGKGPRSRGEVAYDDGYGKLLAGDDAFAADADLHALISHALALRNCIDLAQAFGSPAYD